MTDSTALRQTLFHQFELLIRALDEFCEGVLEDRDYAAWVALRDEEVGRDMREKAVKLYQSMWYEDGQDGRDTLTCPGIIGASPATIEKAQVLNEVKASFKTAVLELKRLAKSENRQLVNDLHARSLSINTLMRQFGAARLNLKEAYRRVPILPQTPLRVGFTWSQFGRVIQRMTLTEVREMLENRRNTPQVLADREKLAEIVQDEPFARIRPVRPHLRANVMYPSAEGSTFRKLIQTPVPVILPLSIHQPLPDYLDAPADPPMIQRNQRRDARIENEPFLPSLRIHRYRSPYRKSPAPKHIKS